MTAEMLSNPVVVEKSPEIPEEPQPSSGLSQSQINSVNVNQPPSSNDPFSISKNRINAEVRNIGSSALFEKLNGSKSTVTPMFGGGGTNFQGLDTPTGYGGGMSPEILYGKEAGGPMTTIPSSTEPPTAPARKGRTLQGLGMDFTIDAPPKMRSNSVKSKSQSKGGSEEADITAGSRPLVQSSGIGQLKRTVSGQPSQSTSTNSGFSANPSSNDPMAPQRRSVRLFNQIRPASGKFAASTASANLGARDGRDLKKAKATGTKGRSTNTYVGRVVSGNRKHNDAMDVDSKEQRPIPTIQNVVPSANSKPVVNDKVKEYESLQWLLDLFAKLGIGYFALSHYECQEAVQVFNSITPSQRDTPWVLAQIGRALYEQSLYAEAAKFYARIKIMAPARMEDMEFYSTILWHLKNEIDLAFLAHETIEIDRDSPQAWCAVGNSFSLQKEHAQALKCFKRATQLDSKFTYGFTLQGHEHIATEEYDKALAAYRSSIAAEPRHWSAWYGLGRVFEKQGKYDFAEQHYRTAARINPTNAVLVCRIGCMLEKQKNPRAALAQYTRSSEMAPKIALTRYNKARVLHALHEHEKALVELKILKDIAPDEANVHFLLAQVYKALKQKGGAIKHYTTALNLDPKVSYNAIYVSLKKWESKRLTLTRFLGFAFHQRVHGADGTLLGG